MFSTNSWLARIPTWAFVALIYILALVCNWPAMQGELLWDDSAHVTRSDMQSWNGLARIWTEVLATQQYYPVLHSAFWIEHRLWGDNTFGYHLINVLQHALAACLLALILRRLWAPSAGIAGETDPNTAPRRVPAGAEWLAAALFVAHPVCVESVAWISEQKNTLSLVFYLLAALVYLRFEAERRLLAYAGATLFFLLALGSKTVTATLPAALLVVLWWKNGKLSWRRDVLPLLPWFVLAILAGLSTVWIEKNLIGADGDHYALSLAQRFPLAGRILWFYFGSLVWPTNLAFFYELWEVPQRAATWTFHLLAAVITIVVFWSIRTRSRGPLAVWLLFAGTIFPALGFFNVYPFAFSYVADHFQYHASISIAAGAAALVALLIKRSTAPARLVVATLCGTLLLTLVHLSRTESGHYINNETLFRANTELVPNNWMARHLLGSAISKEPGREQEAIVHFQKAIELNPKDPDSTYRLGAILIKIPERESEAFTLFKRAIELRPNFAEAHYRLALVIQKDPDRTTEAIEHYRVAIETKPQFAEPRYQLANLLARIPDRWPEAMAQYEETLRVKPDFPEAHNAYGKEVAKIPSRRELALEHLKRAISLNPEFAEAHFNLGTVLAALPGHMEEAIHHFETSLQLQPTQIGVYFSLANAYAASRQFDKAIRYYETILSHMPDFAPAHAHLANILATYPERVPEAIRHYDQAIRLNPEYVDAHNGLALIYAQSGRLDKAKENWEKVLRIDPQNKIARENLERLEQLRSSP